MPSARSFSCLVAAAAVAAALLAPGAGARANATLPLNVAFTATGVIAVTLGDGTPVGTTSGSPTQIPAGFYTVWITGPGGCTQVPHFELNGPGVSIFDNLQEGETGNDSYNVELQPGATYTWKSDAAPTVVHTFTTGTTIQGTPPSTGPIESSKHTVGTSQSLVGSSLTPSHGKLAAAVNAAGKLTLDYDGKTAAALQAGSYAITITDTSKTSGFALAKGRRSTILSDAAYTGKRTVTMTLTAGTCSAGARTRARSSSAEASSAGGSLAASPGPFRARRWLPPPSASRGRGRRSWAPR
jgi:hypothetical protein